MPKQHENRKLGETLTAATDGQGSVRVQRPNIDAFQERIGVLIAEAGSIAAVARKSGISESTVKNWADGISDASRARCIALAEGTGVSLLWLVAGEGPMLKDAAVAPAASQSMQLDTGTLREAMRAIAMVEAETGGTLDLDSRAEAVRLAYEILEESGGALKTDKLVGIIRRFAA